MSEKIYIFFTTVILLVLLFFTYNKAKKDVQNNLKRKENIQAVMENLKTKNENIQALNELLAQKLSIYDKSIGREEE